MQNLAVPVPLSTSDPRFGPSTIFLSGVLFAALLLGVAAAPAASATQVYKRVNPDGSVSFSDTPEPGSVPVEVRPLTVIPSQPAVKAREQGGNAAPKDFKGYGQFTIVNPQPDATLRDAGGSVLVAVLLEPTLQAGHRIEYFVDGRSMAADGGGTSLTLDNLERGSHTVQALVVDGEGSPLASTDPVTFHVQRTSLQQGGGTPVPGGAKGGAGAVGTGAGAAPTPPPSN